MFKPNRTAAHASIVDQSFEELDKLARQAAQAGEDDIEDLDDDSDDTDLGEDDTDSEDGDDTDFGDDEEGSDDEDDLESEDDDSASDEDEDDEDSDDAEYSDESEAEDEDEEEVIVDEDGDESDDDSAEDDDGEFDTLAEDEGDEDEVIIDEDEDESGDDEDEDSDTSNEDEVLAALKAEGLCVVIGSAESISRHEFGLAVASLEDDEFDEDDEADASDDEYEDTDSSEDEDADDSDDDVIDDGSEDEDDTDSEDDADSDIEDEDEDEDEGSDDEEFAEGGDDEDEEIEVDADEEELDEDRLAAVASEEFLAAASASDVDFSFYADSTNPVWNVIVAGVPAARIALSSYGDGASEVASFFRTPAFAEGIRRAMASEGVLPLLQRSNAEFYANSYKSSELFAEAAASAESVATRKVTAALSGLREDFVDAMKIVSAGMDKNFFPTRTNHLKRALFIALSNAGVHNPQSVIETAFAANAAHFETLAEMATELLDKPAEHRDALREAVEEAGVIDRSVKNEESPAAVASANPGLVLARAMANTVTASDAFRLEGSVASQKNALKSLGAGLLG